MKKLLLSSVLLLTLTSLVAQTTYPDVAPIFFSRCTSCHHEDSHAPSFLTYSGILPHITTMDAYLTSGYMPPWSPDTTYSRFSHERTIAPAEKAAILNWIANGAPAGDTTLAPPAPMYSHYQLNGTPDLELTIPTFASNAATDDSYVCFSLPSGLTQDRIVQAFEIVAGNSEIVHHVLANVDTLATTTNDLSGACYSITGDYSLGGFAPGAAPTVFPSTGQLKMGITIKAGSKIILQIHYPMGTAGQLDSTKIRLFFYPLGTTGVRPVYVTTPLQNWALNIPPNTVKTFHAVYPSSGGLTYPISMFAAFPHAHKLGTTMVNYAFMAGDTIPLIRINQWDFQWQGYYTYRNLTKVPTGYTLKGTHVYDNTVNNPNNPTSPPAQVYAGTSTTDEMFFDSFQWLLYQTGDELINMDSLLSLDPLLNPTVGITEGPVLNNDLNTYAFPNPFNHNVTIGYMLDVPGNVSIDVYTVYGTRVRSLQNEMTATGAHEVVWDGKNDSGSQVAAGSYIYIVRTPVRQNDGKLTLISGK
ncbi:MAG: hypothetical protein K0S44_2291 [Bacteroidetes bacterium]|jgi:hypothetical protein|nr:hypothetical protein [Bacteroidota bacterium]